MSRFVFLAHFVFVLNISLAQTEVVNSCEIDSSYYKMIFKEFNADVDGYLDLKRVYRRSFYYLDRTRTDLCNLKLFALLFDQLLASGLDIHFDRLGNTSYMNSTDLPLDSPFIIEMDATNKKIDKYYNYYFLVQKYMSKMKLRVDTNPDLHEMEVDNLVKYGNLSHPSAVKDFLMLKLEPSRK